jgi:hypothetical protein
LRLEWLYSYTGRNSAGYRSSLGWEDISKSVDEEFQEPGSMDSLLSVQGIGKSRRSSPFPRPRNFRRLYRERFGKGFGRYIYLRMGCNLEKNEDVESIDHDLMVTQIDN